MDGLRSIEKGFSSPSGTRRKTQTSGPSSIGYSVMRLSCTTGRSRGCSPQPLRAAVDLSLSRQWGLSRPHILWAAPAES